jgi:hypothetical protein
MFNLSNIKADAAKYVNRDKRWITTLKRLADYDKANGSIIRGGISAVTGGSIPIPNGTLVLSSSDVDYISQSSGVNLDIIENSRKLAKSLFLIGIVVVSDSAESMKVFFPDQDVDWDIQSVAAMDAEVAKMDNSALESELRKSMMFGGKRND